MERYGDGASLDPLRDACANGTVMIWVMDSQDVAMAQSIARTMCESMGLEGEARSTALDEVSEKGGELTRPDVRGMLMLCPRGAGLSVHAVNLLASGREEGPKVRCRDGEGARLL